MAGFGKLPSVKQSIVTLDMEGVLIPEIWIAVAEKTGIKELRRTTRDEPDYDKLMRGRLKILDQHGLKLSDIQQVIGTLRPLDGAKEFLDELRSLVQVIILSDTFEEFAKPIMRQLEWPAIFCNHLVIEDGRIAGDGTPREILNPALIARVFGVQATVHGGLNGAWMTYEA